MKIQECLTKKLATPFSTGNSLSPTIKWHGDSKLCLVFEGSCLKQFIGSTNRIIFFIVYELDTWSRDLNSYFTLKGCSFGGAKLGINACTDKYLYSGNGIGFVRVQNFHLTIA